MTISILGCGWLGLPLAESLIKKGHRLKGSTTTAEKISALQKKEIETYLIKLEPDLQCQNCESFWDSDLLILNVPPGRGRENVIEYHTTQIRQVAEHAELAQIKHIIFISSTSVYPQHCGLAVEEDAKEGKAGRDSGEAALQAERILQQNKAFDTTILRFGGLYGYDRHPVKYLAGRTGLAKGKAPVNLIHRDDCIGIIEQIIAEEVKGEVFNAVSDGHPPRKMYYTTVAKRQGLTPPKFNKDRQKDYKIVSNQKLKKRLNYHFLYPNPLDSE